MAQQKLVAPKIQTPIKAPAPSKPPAPVKTQQTVNPVAAGKGPEKSQTGSTVPVDPKEKLSVNFDEAAKPEVGPSDDLLAGLADNYETTQAAEQAPAAASGVPNEDPGFTRTAPMSAEDQAKWGEKLGTQTLRVNEFDSPQVNALQTLLRDCQSSGIRADSDFGPNTKQAVEEFQQRQGLDVTGAVDQTTRERLLTSEGRTPVEGSTSGGTKGLVSDIQGLAASDKEWWKGKTETQPGAYQKVGEYWKSLGLKLDGRNTGQPWSAAYITSLHDRAGVSNFPGATSHSDYIRDAITARASGDDKAPYTAYRPGERNPQVGDLVCANRPGADGRQNRFTQDNFPSGFTPTHCDVVTGAGPDGITVQGGNVNNSVRDRVLPTDANGGLVQRDHNPFISILAPQNLERAS